MWSGTNGLGWWGCYIVSVLVLLLLLFILIEDKDNELKVNGDLIFK